MITVESAANTAALVNALVTNLAAQPLKYVFLRLADPDLTGHAEGWDVTPGSTYCNTSKSVDNLLGVIFNLIDRSSQLTGHTALVLTADHGGFGRGHDNPALPADYTVPFYVWGPGVMAGADLYALNRATRLDPGTNRLSYAAPTQPIRNGEAANVALKLLGLGPVPGSTINRAQDRAMTIPTPTDFRLNLTATGVVLSFTSVANVLYDIQRRDDARVAAWINVATNLRGTGGLITNIQARAAATAQQYYRLRIHF